MLMRIAVKFPRLFTELIRRLIGFIVCIIHRTYRPLLALAAVLSFAVVICNSYVSSSASGELYTHTDNIPYRKAGLVLGTARLLPGNRINLYFKYRIDAAAALYEARKISYIVVSGDNRKHSYNEPREMKRELVKAGIPDSVIFLDYAGFRTYDSMIRMHKIFGKKSFTVISKQFHNERAIFIAKHSGLDVIGFNAHDVHAYAGFKTMLREKFARVKVILDIIFNVRPRFLGEEVKIP
jgi:SanA protein